MNRRIRVLLFSEGVTASQIVRLVTLGRALDSQRFEVAFACSQFDEAIFADCTFARHYVNSPDPEDVLRAMRQGRRLYNERQLARQVNEDLRVFEIVKPDLVVGDFRWSLTISAAVYGVTHAALANAYWSPFIPRSSFPVPDHPMVRLLGEERTARYFPIALPRVFAWFAEPVNALRRKHGLTEIGSLPQVLTHGDYTLYADPEALVPTPNAPDTHVHLGYVPWAPKGALPDAVRERPLDRPLVYATVGSSGSIDVLPRVVEALGKLPVIGLVATAGRKAAFKTPPNVVLQDFVPGDLAAREAALVITNGGSSSSYQALAEGKPVLGLASNLDQFLAMEAIERHCAGILLRARSATSASILQSVQTLLQSELHQKGAAEVQHMIESSNAPLRFAQFVTHAVGQARMGTKALPAAARLVVALGMVIWSVLLGSELRAEPSVPPARGQIQFTTTTHASTGRVVCALFQKAGWLERPVATATVAIRRRTATCVFEGVKHGTYAVIAFHDANANGDIDRNFLGLPTEDWCASRNAPALFGPPLFEFAKFNTSSSVERRACDM